MVRELIEDAIARRKPLLIEYQSAWSGRPTVRRIDPVNLDKTGSAPSLSGYCHVKQGARGFRLSRIAGIRMLEDESF